MTAAANMSPFDLQLPAEVLAVVHAVGAAGGRLWLVGGGVRDRLLGRTVVDFDLATDLPPPSLIAAFPGADRRDERLGTVTVQTAGHRIVFTTLRVDGPYLDQRHPESVRFVHTPEEDALRRDFTVNAIYADVLDGAILDPVAGLADLRACRLKVIGDPAVRFVEDPLRVLRGLRFAAHHRLAIEPQTKAAMMAAAPLLESLPVERIFVELTAAFTGPGRGRALRLAVELGVAAALLPEVVPMAGVPHPIEYHPEGDVLSHVCLVLAFTRPDPIQAWAAVLHDAGKPATFSRGTDRIRFSGHDVVSAEIAEATLTRLRAPRDVREAVVDICREHIRFAALPSMARNKRERFLRGPRFRHHLEFHRADCLASHGKLDIYQAMAREFDSLPPLPPPPLCTGADVLALGVAPGPEVGRILRETTRRVDEADIIDRVQALDILKLVVADCIKDRFASDDTGPGEDPGR